MKRKFFDITSDGNVATILLYGDIGRWNDEVSDADIVTKFKEAESSFRRINVHINSGGGEVYMGIAIFNAFRNSQSDVRIYVDGIAASMASVIALCGKPVEMSKYAQLMLHRPSGGCYGTSEELRETVAQIETLETTLAEMYSEKTGKGVDEIKSSYFDGKDHWLTAQQALALGFIDGIYDAKPVPDGSTPQDIYRIFTNRLQGSHKNPRDMNIDDLKKQPAFKDCASDEDVYRVIAKLQEDAAKASGLTTDLEKERAALKVFQDKEKADKEAAKKKLLDEAEADGRINAKTRPTFQALLDADPENGKAAIEALTKKKWANHTIASEDGKGNTSGAWEKRQQEIVDKLKSNR
jgi:ATP-dependent Clp endopeptidase proteolytic subunit ClpP